jgi:hypothetical protein
MRRRRCWRGKTKKTLIRASEKGKLPLMLPLPIQIMPLSTVCLRIDGDQKETGISGNPHMQAVFSGPEETIIFHYRRSV